MKLLEALEKGWELGQAAGVKHITGLMISTEVDDEGKREICSACAMGFAIIGIAGTVKVPKGHTDWHDWLWFEREKLMEELEPIEETQLVRWNDHELLTMETIIEKVRNNETERSDS